MDLEPTRAAAARPLLPALPLPRSTEALPTTNTSPTKPSPMDTDEPAAGDAETTRLPAVPQPVQAPAPILASGQDHPEVDAWLLPALHKHGGEDFAAIASDPSFDGPRRGRTAEELEVALTAWLTRPITPKPKPKPKPRGYAPKNASGAPATWDPDRGEWIGVVKKKPKPKATPKPKRKPVPAPTRSSARNAGVQAPPVDDDAGRTIRKGAARRDGTELDWEKPTPDESARNLYQVLKDEVVILDDDISWFSNLDEEASWLVQRLKQSHPRSFPSPDVDCMLAFRTKVRQIRDELQGKPDAPYSSTTCPGMGQFVPEFQKMALVKCAAIGSAGGVVATYGCIPFFVLALVAMYGLCFLTLHVPSFERATRIVKANFREAAAGLMSTIAVCLGWRQDGEGFSSKTNMSPRTAPLFLYRHVLLKALGLAGDNGTYHRQTFMARACGVGLRLPFYVMIYSLNVFMFCVRAYPAVYQLAADCFFGRMAAGLRPLWMATNALFEGEGTVGHDFLRWTYISGAELREVVGLMGPGGRARIRIRKRLGKVLEYVWEGTSQKALKQSFFEFYNAARHELDGIGTSFGAARCRLQSLQGKKKSVGDDEAIYGAPFDFSVRVYVDGFWQWVRGGRKLDGDEFELAAAKALNDAHELRLEGKEFVVEDHAGPHFELWPGDKGLRARLLGLRKYADHAYYLFHAFILPAVIVDVWLHQDSDFERAVAAAEAEAEAAEAAGLAAGRALRVANGQAAVSERRCVGGSAGTRSNKGVASVMALFAGIASGLVQGCRELAAAARASSYDALLTRARNDHVRICAPTFARVRATHPLERAVQLGAVEFDAYLLIALRRRLYSFDRPTKARALKEIRRIEESCPGEGGLSRLPRVGMPQPMSF